MKIFNLDSPLMQILAKLGTLIWLNVLTVVLTIPVITAGPALTALHSVTLKMVREEDGNITASYFRSFRSNFRQGVCIWLILLAAAGLTVLDLYLVVDRGLLYLRLPLFTVLAVVIFLALYVFPILSHFANTVGQTLKNALILSLIRLPQTLAMGLFYLIPIGLVWLSEGFAPIWVLFGLAVPAYFSSKLYHPIFAKLEADSKEIN